MLRPSHSSTNLGRKKKKIKKGREIKEYGPWINATTRSKKIRGKPTTTKKKRRKEVKKENNKRRGNKDGTSLVSSQT